MATNGGQRLGDLTISANGSLATTSGPDGTFSLNIPNPSSGVSLVVSGPNIVSRSVTALPRAGLLLDVFGPGFDLSFYRRFARNGYDQPFSLRAITRWTQAPRIYLRTIDEAGQPVDSVTLETTADALSSTAALWSGGRFGLAAIERGIETREGFRGYITVKWRNPAVVGSCGQATVGPDGGWIELEYLRPTVCGCAGSGVRPRTVRHELGHSFGYSHTGEAQDLMSGLPTAGCDAQLSLREIEYAQYMYSRPPGNLDPDTDPVTVLAGQPARVAVD